MQWMDRWMDGWGTSLPSVLSFPSVRCSDAPVTETSRSQSGEKNFIHTDCQSCGERPIGEQRPKCAASHWLVLWVGGRFTVWDLIYSLSLSLFCLQDLSPLQTVF